MRETVLIFLSIICIGNGSLALFVAGLGMEGRTTAKKF